MADILTDFFFFRKKVHTSKGMLMPVDMGNNLKKGKKANTPENGKALEPFPGKKGSSCEWSTLMWVGPQLAAITFSKRGKDKLLGLTNDALLLLFLLADKTISCRLESNIQSCFHSRSHFLPFSFAFQAGHLVAPDSIINCALHSIYLSCFFSGNTSAVCVRDPHLLYATYAYF